MTQKRYFQKKLLAVTVSAASIVAADVALAEGNELLEEVMVTATRRASSTQDIPYNISATTSEQMEQRGIADFTNLARSVTGLTMVESGPRNAGINSGLIIRGLNTRGALSNDLKSAQEPTVSTYMGEMPMFVNFHLKDIDRVEVLRGPQGTLYGSGSLGGTIRYIPNKPDTSEFYGEVGSRISMTAKANGMNNDTYAVLNIPLSDNFAIRAVGGYVKNQGFIDANGLLVLDDNGQQVFANPGDEADIDAVPLTYSKKDTNGDQVKHMRVSALWDINDMANVTFTHQRQKDEAEGVQAVGGYEYGGGDFAHANRFLEPLEREVELSAMDIEVDMDFARLSSSTSIAKNNAVLDTDQSGIYLNADWYYSLGYNMGPRSAVLGDGYTQDAKAFAQEIRLASNSDGNLDWVVGAFYQKLEQQNLSLDKYTGWFENNFNNGYYGYPLGRFPDEWNSYYAAYGMGPYWFTDYSELEDIDPRVATVDSAYFQRQNTVFKDMAVFGEFSYRFTDRLQATLGIRYFRQKYDSSNEIFLIGCGAWCANDSVYNSFGLLDVVGDRTGRTGGALSTKVNDFITKLNISYDLNEETMVYLTRAEGFRHGGSNGIPTLDKTPNAPMAEDPILAEYKQDEAVNWELGLKGTALDGNLRYSSALFYIDWKDVQIDAGSPNGGFPIVLNGDNARSMGIEFEGIYAVTDNLTATLGYSYTKAELTEDFVLGEKLGFKGDPLPNVPRQSASLQLNHYQPLENGLELVTNLNGTIVSSSQSDLNELSPDYSEYAGYAMWDASLALQAENWSVSLFVNNLADKYALTNPRGFRYANSLNPQMGRELTGFVNRPRTVGVGFKYQF